MLRLPPMPDDARELAVRDDEPFVASEDERLRVGVVDVAELELADALDLQGAKVSRLLAAWPMASSNRVCPFLVCFLAMSRSDWKARLSQQKTREPAQKPSGNDLSRLLRMPTARVIPVARVVARSSVPELRIVSAQPKASPLDHEPGVGQEPLYRVHHRRMAHGEPGRGRLRYWDERQVIA